jgi:hypothetical protein
MSKSNVELRNFSPQKMFVNWASKYSPTLSFDRDSWPDFQIWKDTVTPQIIASLGDFPPIPPPEPVMIAEWEHRGLKKQRWTINVLDGLSTTVQINIPLDLKHGEKRPALLCWHGHGQFGMEPIMGSDASAAIQEEKRRFNCDYGQRMAEAGFITFATEWMGQGEHNDDHKPNWNSQRGGRSWCDIYYLHASMLGSTPMAINLSIGMAATNFVCGLPGIDPSRLGVMGISGGGTLALWSALCDSRFQAVEIICYSDVFSAFGYRDVSYCGMQIAPGLFKLVDVPDLQGLLAPRPLLVDIGIHDGTFKLDTAMACYHRVKEIYECAEAQDKLELDLFPGSHSWGGNKSTAFFSKWLNK